jgi:dTDP-4-amino-4,6-dideoxygalactose transaminase
VFVDVDPKTRNIDLSLIQPNGKTKAIIPVDLAGLPVDRDQLYSLAKKHNLRVVEDAAQAFGASWKGKPIGSFGDLVSFSFHANKNITTVEGGALVLPDESLISLCERLRFQGVTRSGEDGMDCDVLGGKANLTDVAARVGLGQLPHLKAFTERRRALAKRYFANWDRSLGCELPVEDFENSNWHMFQVVLPEKKSRSAFIAAMREAGIGIGVHYPAMHLFSLYRSLGWREGQFPHAERIGRSIATLPLFPAMHDADVDASEATEVLQCSRRHPGYNEADGLPRFVALPGARCARRLQAIPRQRRRSRLGGDPARAARARPRHDARHPAERHRPAHGDLAGFERTAASAW